VDTRHADLKTLKEKHWEHGECTDVPNSECTSAEFSCTRLALALTFDILDGCFCFTGNRLQTRPAMAISFLHSNEDISNVFVLFQTRVPSRTNRRDLTLEFTL
jgi:hypothetical protein